MKPADIRKMTAEELDKAEADARKEIFNLRRKALTGQLEKPSQIRILRKDIARIETEKTARAHKADK